MQKGFCIQRALECFADCIIRRPRKGASTTNLVHDSQFVRHRESESCHAAACFALIRRLRVRRMRASFQNPFCNPAQPSNTLSSISPTVTVSTVWVYTVSPSTAMEAYTSSPVSTLTK